MEANPAVGTTAGLTDVNIVDASSPLAAGLSAGLHTVVTSPQTFSQGTPTGAHIVATMATDPTQAIIYNYETGEKGFNNFVMPARRVFFFFQDVTAAAANDDGWKLFDAAVDWAQNLTATTTPTAPVITKVNLGANNTIHIEWTGGGTLEVSDKVTGGTWTDTGLSSPADAPIDRAMRFGRVKRAP